jgi:hypothetical protein
MSDDTTQSEVSRGLRARAILDDPLVADAFAALERECLAEWRRAPARDVEGRERIWLMLKLTERLKAHFETLISDGAIAVDRLARLDRERRFRFLR